MLVLSINTSDTMRSRLGLFLSKDPLSVLLLNLCLNAWDFRLETARQRNEWTRTRLTCLHSWNRPIHYRVFILKEGWYIDEYFNLADLSFVMFCEWFQMCWENENVFSFVSMCFFLLFLLRRCYFPENKSFWKTATVTIVTSFRWRFYHSSSFTVVCPAQGESLGRGGSR